MNNTKDVADVFVNSMELLVDEESNNDSKRKLASIQTITLLKYVQLPSSNASLESLPKLSLSSRIFKSQFIKLLPIRLK